mgnify:CR=1 FL=1
MRRLLSACLTLLLATSVNAKQIAGIDMPDQLERDGQQLMLSGAGIRTKMFMDIYAGGLYVQSAGGDAEQIVTANKAMAIRLHIVSSLVSSEAMEEATREGFDNATGGNTAPLAEHIDAFIAVFREPIVEGDNFDIVYLPEQGLKIYKNGNYKSTVDGGLAFKQATFAIWLGDKPADKGLKKGMLSQ